MLLDFAKHTLSLIAVAIGLFICGLSGVLSSQDASESGSLRFVVLGCMLIGTVCAGLHLLFQPIDRRFIRIGIGGLVMVAAQAIAFMAAGTFARIDERRFLETMVQQLLVIGWIYFGLTLDWRRTSTWVVAHLSGIAILGVNLILWAGEQFRIPFEGLSSAKNALAACACVGIFLAIAMWLRFEKLIPKLASLSLGILGLASLVASGGRASGMVVLVCMIAFAGWTIFRQSRLGPILVTSVLILAMTAIPFVYINMGRMSWFSGLDDMFSSITHSIYSGRETIWPEVIDGILEHPVLGNGTSASWRFVRSEHGITQELSAHNLYLSILYQSGILGLLGFIFLISVLFRALWTMPDSPHLRLSFAILVAVLFREAWEVSLTQNTLQIGLSSWILVTLGLSLSSRDEFAQDVADDRELDQEDSDENVPVGSEGIEDENSMVDAEVSS